MDCIYWIIILSVLGRGGCKNSQNSGNNCFNTGCVSNNTGCGHASNNSCGCAQPAANNCGCSNTASFACDRQGQYMPYGGSNNCDC